MRNSLPWCLAMLLSFGMGGTALAQAPVSSGTVITIAGNGSAGFSGDGGPATNATLNTPYGLAIGPDGTLYFADSSNYRIRAINPTTGLITTVAGNGTLGDTGDDGQATNALVSGVLSVAVDRARHALYLADIDNNRVRKVNLTNGIISNFAGTGIFGVGFSGDGGPATLAEFSLPEGVCVDGTGRLTIVDVLNERIRQVNPVTGIITTIAGDGSVGSAGDGGWATNASFGLPRRVAADRAGNVFVLDSATPVLVRRIDVGSGIITRVAGGGTNAPGSGLATNMNLAGSEDLTVDQAGTTLYIGGNYHRVFKVDLATGQLSPFAGSGTNGFSGDGGPALEAQFASITGVAVVPGGGLLISDWINSRIRYVVPDSINLVNDSGQTEFHLPWVSALTGDVTIVNNTSLTNIMVSSLTSVAGDVSISGNLGVTGVALSSLETAAGTVTITDNPLATTVDLGSLTTTTGSVDIGGNTALADVDLSALTSVGGTVSVDQNPAATSVDIGALVSAGSVFINDNSSATTVDLGSLTNATGSVAIGGNGALSTFDLNSLETAGGGVAITDNPSVTNVAMGSLTGVTGDVTISGNTAATNVDLSSLTAATGDVTIESNAPNASVNLNSLTSFGCGTDEVTITLDGGTFELTNGLTLCTNATLTGSSTVDGSVTNNGTIEPGSSPGQLNITGQLVLGSGSALRLEIGGYAQGQFDFVNVAGSVALGGALSVSLINNFPSVMTNGASFTLLTAGSPLTGTFANAPSGGSLTTTDGYVRFTVLYAGESTVRLTDLVIVDTDGDGLPDWWEDQFSLNKTNSADAALDLDSDGASNGNEFLAGTIPTNAASLFHISGIGSEAGGVRVSWTAVGGRSYVVQYQTNATAGVTTNFTDLSPLISMEGAVEGATNYLHLGGATNSGGYYRVRLWP